MLIPSLPMGNSGPQTSTSGSGDRGQLVLSVSQMPVKSGLPSGVRGDGAERFGFPSEVLGTPAVGYFNHWPKAVADEPRLALTAMAKHAERIMDVLMLYYRANTTVAGVDVGTMSIDVNPASASHAR